MEYIVFYVAMQYIFDTIAYTLSYGEMAIILETLPGL